MSEKELKVSGKEFADLSEEEMKELAGQGDIDPETTPATPAVSYVSAAVSGALSGAVVSYVASAAVKC